MQLDIKFWSKVRLRPSPSRPTLTARVALRPRFGLCLWSKPGLRRTLALSVSNVFESTLTIGGRLFWCLLGTLSVLALRVAWI